MFSILHRNIFLQIKIKINYLSFSLLSTWKNINKVKKNNIEIYQSHIFIPIAIMNVIIIELNQKISTHKEIKIDKKNEIKMHKFKITIDIVVIKFFELA